MGEGPDGVAQLREFEAKYEALLYATGPIFAIIELSSSDEDSSNGSLSAASNGLPYTGNTSASESENECSDDDSFMSVNYEADETRTRSSDDKEDDD